MRTAEHAPDSCPAARDAKACAETDVDPKLGQCAGALGLVGLAVAVAVATNIAVAVAVACCITVAGGCRTAFLRQDERALDRSEVGHVATRRVEGRDDVLDVLVVVLGRSHGSDRYVGEGLHLYGAVVGLAGKAPVQRRLATVGHAEQGLEHKVSAAGGLWEGVRDRIGLGLAARAACLGEHLRQFVRANFARNLHVVVQRDGALE